MYEELTIHSFSKVVKLGTAEKEAAALLLSI